MDIGYLNLNLGAMFSNKSLQFRRERVFERNLVSDNHLSGETAEIEREDVLYNGIEMWVRTSQLKRFAKIEGSLAVRVQLVHMGSGVQQQFNGGGNFLIVIQLTRRK